MTDQAESRTYQSMVRSLGKSQGTNAKREGRVKCNREKRVNLNSTWKGSISTSPYSMSMIILTSEDCRILPRNVSAPPTMATTTATVMARVLNRNSNCPRDSFDLR